MFPVVFVGYRLLLQLQLLYVALPSPFSFDWFIFIRFRVEVFIANIVAVGSVKPVDPLHGLPSRFTCK